MQAQVERSDRPGPLDGIQDLLFELGERLVLRGGLVPRVGRDAGDLARGQKPRASYGKWAKPLREGHGKTQRFRHSSVSLWPRSGDAAPACPGFLTKCGDLGRGEPELGEEGDEEGRALRDRAVALDPAAAPGEVA